MNDRIAIRLQVAALRAANLEHQRSSSRRMRFKFLSRFPGGKPHALFLKALDRLFFLLGVPESRQVAFDNFVVLPGVSEFLNR
jgi:hypothetical protein